MGRLGGLVVCEEIREMMNSLSTRLEARDAGAEGMVRNVCNSGMTWPRQMV